MYTLVALLAVGGCGSHVTIPPTISKIVRCETLWREACSGCGRASSPAMPAGVLNIGVVFHLMRAYSPDIDDDIREKLLAEGKEPAWKLAPDADAVANIWTDATIDALFRSDGTVNDIWKQAKIRLSPRLVESCTYWSEKLRLDGRPRESMFTPESQMPWAPQLFHSINRLFTSSDPRVIHVLIWWSIQEDDSGFQVQGYSRSAAHGGPAVWADAYQCLRISDDPSGYYAMNYGGCGRLLAHEIGHTFGLQHVDDSTNLMNRWYSAVSLTPQQVERARREVRQQFMAK